MMRKLTFLLFTSLFAMTVNARDSDWSFGPKLGMNLSSITDSYHLTYRAGVTVGGFVDYRFLPIVGVSLDVLYSYQGYNQGSFYTDRHNFHYLNIPIMAKVYLVKGLSVNAGIQPGYLLAASTNGNKNDHYKTADFGFPLGLSYQFPGGFQFEARYTIGVSNILESRGCATSESQNRVFVIMAGWRF